MSISVSRGGHAATDQEPRKAVGVSRWLSLGALFGPLLFAAAWFTLGFVSPGYTIFGNRVAPYSPISQPISGLGLGITALFMNTAFVLSGILLAAGIVVIRQIFRTLYQPGIRWFHTALLLLSPLGLMIDGIFTLEAVFPHLIGFLLATASPVISFLVLGLFLRGKPGWRRFGNGLLLASPLTLILVILFFLTFDPMASGSNTGIAGLIQRILVIEVHAWFAALGWLAFKR